MDRPNYLWCYGRESKLRQMEGGGPERQLEADWGGFAARHGFVVHPDRLFDEGRSAWSEENWREDAALGKFVHMAEKGRGVRPGDCLACENWDRLVRLKPRRALKQLGRLLDAGIHLGDVTRGKLIRADSDEMMDILDLMMVSGRGNEESETKSQRCSVEWQKRQALAESGELVKTLTLPCWVKAVPCPEGTLGARLAGSRKKPFWALLVEREPQASTVRHVLKLAAEGMGPYQIVGEMVEHGIESPGGKNWSPQWVGRLLRDRRLIGEHALDPRTAKGSFDKMDSAKGPVIPDYFPKLVTEGELLALSAGRGGRRGQRGRDSLLPNPFKGLLIDALTGGHFIRGSSTTRTKGRRAVLLPADSAKGRSAYTSFDYAVFEECVLKKLEEIDPADILGPSRAAKGIGELSGKLTATREELARVKKSLNTKGYSEALDEAARNLESREEELKEALAVAQHRERHPLAEAWGEQKGLLETIKNATDQKAVRLALRARLKETIEKIYLLVSPFHGGRFAAVQVNFRGGKGVGYRHYLIRYDRGTNLPRCRRPPSWEVVSWRSKGQWRGIDLSSPEDAAAFGKFLSSGVSCQDLNASMYASE